MLTKYAVSFITRYINKEDGKINSVKRNVQVYAKNEDEAKIEALNRFPGVLSSSRPKVSLVV